MSHITAAVLILLGLLGVAWFVAALGDLAGMLEVGA